jgi:hypothetical protein
MYRFGQINGAIGERMICVSEHDRKNARQIKNIQITKKSNNDIQRTGFSQNHQFCIINKLAGQPVQPDKIGDINLDLCKNIFTTISFWFTA